MKTNILSNFFSSDKIFVSQLKSYDPLYLGQNRSFNIFFRQNSAEIARYVVNCLL